MSVEPTPANVDVAPADVSPWTVFRLSCCAVFLVSLDATIAVAAFPALREGFADTTPAALSWVLNAYTIVYAALLAPAGRLADLLGRKRLFVGGVVLFTLASGACGLAPNIGLLIAARAVQAVGAALLTPASLALILAAFPREKRAPVVGLFSAVGALAAALGPGVGAALIEATSWRAAFLVNLPVGLALVWLSQRRMVDSRSPETGGRLDLPGVALVIAGVSSLTFALVQARTWGLSDPRIALAAAAGLALLALYMAWARGRPSPAIDLALFQDRTYAWVSVATFVFGIGFSLMFLSSYLFLITVWGFEPGLAGLAMMPGPLVVIPVAIVAGRRAARTGHRPILMTGGVLYASAQAWLLSTVGPDASYWSLWFPAQIMGGTAVGLILPALSGAAVANLPPTRFGVGGAVNNAVRQLGGVFGTALAVVLVAQPDASLDAFQASFTMLLVIGLATALLCRPVDTRHPATAPA